MCDKIIGFLVLLYLFVNNVFANVKPVRYCDKHLQDLLKIGNEVCNGTEFMADFVPDDDSIKNCSDIETNLNGVSYSQYRRDKPDYFKETFVFSVGLERRQVFLNVTITDINFTNLKIRLQNCSNGNSMRWQEVDLNSSHKPQQLSLFFAVRPGYKAKIEFYAQGENDYKFFRQYHFLPPPAITMQSVRILPNRVFLYVDTTFSDTVHFYIEPLPDRYNIVRYEVIFRYIDPNLSEKSEFNLTRDNYHCEQSKFSEDKEYKFVVIPVDNNDIQQNRTSIQLYLHGNDRKLLIMMVTLTVVPIVICFVSYLIYTYYKHRGSRRLRNPACLLVYPATHDSHIAVMVKLAEYLRACRINAMIDVLDAQEEYNGNPKHWYDKSFKKATTVVASWLLPSDSEAVVTETIYRGLDEYAYVLIHRCPTKNYLTLRFPYCEKGGSPIELRSIKPLDIPEQLRRLVNEIHGFKYTELYKTPIPKDLIRLIKLAEQDILYKERGERNQYESKTNCLELLSKIIPPQMEEEALIVDEENSSGEDTNISIQQNASDDKPKYGTYILELDLFQQSKERDTQVMTE